MTLQDKLRVPLNAIIPQFITLKFFVTFFGLGLREAMQCGGKSADLGSQHLKTVI